MIDTRVWIEKLRAGDRSRAASGSGDRGPQRLSREFLEEVLELVVRYARIEKLVLGGATVSYSPVSLEVARHPPADPSAQGEALADGERARLKLPAGPILELQQLIEGQGIKVVPCLFPGPEYSGGFFFDARLGPVILLHAGDSTSEMLCGLAHQYAHFLADFDPYITTLCGFAQASAPEDPIEARAHAMALAFLMPRADLETYREALDGEGAPVSAQLVRHLSVYFDLDPEVVLWRLLALDWIDAAALRLLLAANDELAGSLRRPPAALPAMLLPDRFVRLVASAFGAGRIDLEAAAAYFGTDSDGAETILGQFEYEEGSAAADS